MNKKELIDTLHETVNLPTDQPPVTKSNIERVLDALGGIIQVELFEGNEVALPGIGKLTTSERAARTGRNPQTGASIEIPARRVPAFSAAKALKDAVQGS